MRKIQSYIAEDHSPEQNKPNIQHQKRNKEALSLNEHLIGARHCVQPSIVIIPFDLHENTSLLTFLVDEENEFQRASYLPQSQS